MMINNSYIKINNNKELLLEVLKQLYNLNIKWISGKSCNNIPNDIIDAIYIEDNYITYSSSHEMLCETNKKYKEFKNVTNLFSTNFKSLYED